MLVIYIVILVLQMLMLGLILYDKYGNRNDGENKSEQSYNNNCPCISPVFQEFNTLHGQFNTKLHIITGILSVKNNEPFLFKLIHVTMNIHSVSLHVIMRNNSFIVGSVLIKHFQKLSFRPHVFIKYRIFRHIKFVSSPEVNKKLARSHTGTCRGTNFKPQTSNP